MWDNHWCKGAAARVNELAVPLNDTVRAARDQGVFIIHCPSSVTSYYKNTPQRQLAQDAPLASTPIPLTTYERWGTGWCWPDAKHEGVLPIDDSDMGCDCPTKCTIREAWTRQNPLIEIGKNDAITDNGQEIWNLLVQRGIDNVMICGVHLNMCVLGRPFGIRQMAKLGKNVALIRDMTDTMYNHRAPAGSQPLSRDGAGHRACRALLVPELYKHRHYRQAAVPVQRCARGRRQVVPCRAWSTIWPRSGAHRRRGRAELPTAERRHAGRCHEDRRHCDGPRAGRSRLPRSRRKPAAGAMAEGCGTVRSADPLASDRPFAAQQGRAVVAAGIAHPFGR